jgi:DNA-binding IclR family transcriptional regulator
MLKSLSEAGLVEQNPETRAYRLGWQLYVLAAQAGDQRLVNRGAAVLRAVVLESGETALLSVLDRNQSFTILSERSTHAVQAGGWVGRSSPLHASASGRALLLATPDEEVRELIRHDVGRAGLGPCALKTVPQVLARLRTEREAGCCVAIDELEAGLTSIGVPVQDSTNHIIASLNISGPSFRVSDRLDVLTTTAKSAARKLNTLMTRRPGP